MLSQQISDPSVMSDMKRFIALNKEYRELEPLVEAGEKYRIMVGNLESAKDLLMIEKDEEMREMAKEEISHLEEQIPQIGRAHV